MPAVHPGGAWHDELDIMFSWSYDGFDRMDLSSVHSSHSIASLTVNTRGDVDGSMLTPRRSIQHTAPRFQHGPRFITSNVVVKADVGRAEGRWS